MAKIKTFLGSLKGKLITGAAALLVIAFAFGTGTFHPNPYTLDKLVYKIENVLLERAKKLGLHEPDFKYNSPETFVEAVSACVDYLNFTVHHDERIPKGMIIAMAGIESGWGTSRFAREGNALFGVRTWDLENTPHMKALGNLDASWGVKKYISKCESVRDMIRILNTHSAYEKFREYREDQIADGEWNYGKLLSGMTAWSTNEDYAKIILSTIVDNKLP